MTAKPYGPMAPDGSLYITLTDGNGTLVTAEAPSGAAGGDLGGTYPNPTALKTNGVSFGTLATVTPGTGVATALTINTGTTGAFAVLGSAASFTTLGTSGISNLQGNVAVGANLTPDALLTINANTGATVAPTAGSNYHSVGADGVANGHTFDAFGSNNTFSFRQANGTLASKTASTSASNVVAFNGQGWDTTGYFNGAQLRFFPSETWSATAHGMEIRVSTTPNTTTATAESVRFQNSGGVSIGSAAVSTDPGIGNLLLQGMLKSSVAPTAVAGAGPFLTGSASTLNSRMKVNLNGTDYWIPCSTTAF